MLARRNIHPYCRLPLSNQLGDGPALAAVQRHFQVLFQEFAATGRIVKTVGDCVMAAFPTGEAALTAVAKALDGIATKCRYVHVINTTENSNPLSI